MAESSEQNVGIRKVTLYAEKELYCICNIAPFVSGRDISERESLEVKVKTELPARYRQNNSWTTRKIGECPCSCRSECRMLTKYGVSGGNLQ